MRGLKNHKAFTQNIEQLKSVSNYVVDNLDQIDQSLLSQNSKLVDFACFLIISNCQSGSFTSRIFLFLLGEITEMNKKTISKNTTF